MMKVMDNGNPKENLLFFEETKGREYLLLDKTTMEECPPKTWCFAISGNQVLRISYQRSVGKSRNMAKNNVSKDLRTMLLLMGMNL